ncbi:hypothetical protein SS05631_c08860 [Sinorhizobium sp. CCBAU 05631]|nr:hypothetical protein SS05631_c08860 [Sinorhizobium sp. CCBAU 05631]
MGFAERELELHRHTGDSGISGGLPSGCYRTATVADIRDVDHVQNRGGHPSRF